MLELADHVGATWIVLENVPGLGTSGTPRGEDFRSILQSLSEYGYDTEWRVLDSQNFGVPQRRRRLYLVARRRTATSSGCEVLTQPEGSRWDPPAVLTPWTSAPGRSQGRPGEGLWAGSATQDDVAAPLLSLTGGPRTTDIEGATWVATWSKKHRAASKDDYESWAAEDVSPTINTFDTGDTRATALVTYGFNPMNGGGYGQAHPGLAITKNGTGPLSTSQKVAVATDAVVRRLTPVECERLQAWPDDHTALTADGTPIADSHRYRMCGNGVTATVANYVGWLIGQAR
jgi:DNA (cytosine-5)-methyltransferase 1